MQCPSCWQPNYDPDYARCLSCRRIPLTSNTLSQFVVTQLPPTTRDSKPTKLVVDSRIRKVYSHNKQLKQAVRITGDPNANLTRPAVITRVTEEGIKVTSAMPTNAKPSWMRGFVRVGG